MPFSQQSVDFLFENRLHDSREWFRDHKQTYAEQVTEPMKQLILDVAPAVLKIDPLIEINPARISRIYRDMRLNPDSISATTSGIRSAARASSTMRCRGFISQ